MPRVKVNVLRRCSPPKILTVPSATGHMKFPDMDQNHLSLRQRPEMSLEVVEETLLTLQENQRDCLLELVEAVPRWMF